MKRGTIREERPDLLKYLVNKEDGELSCGSNKYIEAKCPKCGFKKEMKVTKLIKSFYCSNCSTIESSIENKRPDLLKYLTNEKDKYLTYGSSDKIEIKCPYCGNNSKIAVFNLIRKKKVCNNPLCNMNDDYYKYNEGDIINNLLILKKIRYKNNNCSVKGYKVQCLKDKYIYEVRESNLSKGKGCPVCVNQKIVKGINDIATTHPHLISHFVNIEDGYKYSCYSNKTILMKCLNCNTQKETRIYDLTKKGFSCPKCNDGISYPNKLIYNILKYLKVKFITEKTFSWSKNKRYDFYVPSLKCIIEAHGNQHYGSGFSGLGGRTLGEEQENDILKKKLALENNIKYYIVLDCRKSEMEWIKASILNSELPKLLNFIEKNIDWTKCDKESYKSLVYIVCQYYDKIKSIKKIAHLTYLAEATTRNYLKIGNKLKLCEYNAIQIAKENLIGMSMKNNKKVICEGKIFGSIKECASFYHIRPNYLTQFLSKQKPISLFWYSKGLRFENENLLNYKKSKEKGSWVANKKNIFSENQIFNTIKECSEYYNVKPSTMRAWLRGQNKTPQKYIDLGLRYATKEDLNTYPLYEEIEDNNINSNINNNII